MIWEPENWSLCPDDLFTDIFGPSGPKRPIFGFPDLQSLRRRRQLLASHFDTYGNGIKPIYKPKPNSLGIPYISHTQTCVKLVFLGVAFGLRSEPVLKYKGTEYLQLAIPHNFAIFEFCPTLALYKATTPPSLWCRTRQ